MPAPRFGLAAALITGLALTAPASAAGPSASEVRAAVNAAVRYLKSTATPSGAWPERVVYTGGVTALATLALLNAGVSPDDPVVAAALEYLRNVPDSWTYVVSLRIAALAAADPRRFRPDIERSARWLVRAQQPDGQWTYTARPLRGDNSNSQFALLGLHEAARAGIPIPREVWIRAERHWLNAQNKDGGWGYLASRSASTGSMTAAGVASLLIVGHQVNRSVESGYTDKGAAPRCGRYAQHRGLTAGLRWLADNFDASRNPKSAQWHHYWLYGAERAGILSGLKHFGRHDWYREGAAWLVRTQDADGSWNRDLPNTTFALLFLAKGRRPLLINKLAWSRDNSWQPDRHDCENLVAFIGSRLGEPLTWQAVTLDAPLEDWLEAPILYITGHRFPTLSARSRERLRRYVEAGGTIFAEACCSREPFRNGFTAFLKSTFEAHDLLELDASHPVWSSEFQLTPGRFPLMGIDAGCRTSILFSPRDLSCLWEQADVPNLSEEAFQLGANIAAYVTGREPLRDRLDTVVIPRSPRRPDDKPSALGALQLVQLIHNGDCRPDPGALPALAALLNENAGVDIVPHPILLAPDDPRLSDHPIAYLTGHHAFSLSDAQQTALRDWLHRGGFLFADACCGRAAFDAAFRDLCRNLFPDTPPKPLPDDHSILAGRPGYHLDSVAFRPALQRERPDDARPRLEGIDLDGRTAVVYSPWSFGCGLDGHKCFACRGYVEEDSRRIAVNVVLYGLSY